MHSTLTVSCEIQNIQMLVRGHAIHNHSPCEAQNVHGMFEPLDTQAKQHRCRRSSVKHISRHKAAVCALIHAPFTSSAVRLVQSSVNSVSKKYHGTACDMLSHGSRYICEASCSTHPTSFLQPHHGITTCNHADGSHCHKGMHMNEQALILQHSFHIVACCVVRVCV